VIVSGLFTFRIDPCDAPFGCPTGSGVFEVEPALSTNRDKTLRFQLIKVLLYGVLVYVASHGSIPMAETYVAIVVPIVPLNHLHKQSLGGSIEATICAAIHHEIGQLDIQAYADVSAFMVGFSGHETKKGANNAAPLLSIRYGRD
jgi:hypothetical protein